MPKKMYYTIIILIVGAIFITLGAFQYQANASGQSIRATLIVKSQQPDFEFWVLVKKGAQEAAKEFNVDLKIDGPMTEADTQGQIDIVEQAIAEQPDVIILAAVDQQLLLPSAKEIKQNKIDLIMLDSGLSETVENCFVGTDNQAAAKHVGAAMGEDVQQGDIAIISHQMNTSTSVQRIAGFKNGIGSFEDIEIVSTSDIGDSVETSKETTLKVLEEHPNLKGIFATNQISAEGVTAALEESGRAGDITFYAFDSSTVQNEALEQGTVQGFAIQMPFNMGYMAVKAAAEAAAGTLRTTNIDTGFEFATQENMRQEEIQKLIYPFV